MPALIKIESEASVDTYTPPEGFAVLFMQEVEGKLVIKVKLSSGNIVVVGTQSGGTVVQDGAVVLNSEIAYVDEDSGTLEVVGATVDRDTLILPE